MRRAIRDERLDFTRPALAEAASESSRLLMRTAASGEPPEPSLAALGRAVGNWSVVHGFALLLIDGRLAGALAAPACGGRVDVLLDAALGA